MTMALPDVSNLDQRTKDELAGLALALSGNEKTRKRFLGIVKEAAPDTPIPELEAAAAVDAVRKEYDEKLGKVANEFRDYRLQNELGARKKAVIEKYGLDDAAMQKMEEMMGKKELPADYDWAARLYQQQIEPVTPNYGTSGYGPVDLPTDETLMADPDRWSQSSAHQIIDDLRKRAGAGKPF
jgi:hypothetical protein